MKTTYEVKWYNSSKSKDLESALKLYSENIEPAYRTDTNEIIYWIDNFDKKSSDRFFVLGLYLNEVIIGYTQFAYFLTEKFIEVDYLVIHKDYRKNNAFYEFLDKIAYFLTEQGIIYDYILCEVGCYFEDLAPTENSRTLIRLLKMSHFGVIKCAYHVPRLGKTNYESQMRAILMIYSPTELKQIRKETYLLFIQTIFYKYYQRWYSVFFSEKENEEYKLNLDQLYDVIQRDVNHRKSIDINGYQNLLPLNPADFNLVKTKRSVRIITFLLIFIVSVILFAILAVFVKNRYGLDIEKQSAILMFSILVASLLTSLIFGKRTEWISKFVEKLIDKI